MPATCCRWSAPGLEAGLELIVSEYVPGGDDCVEEAILVRAEDGELSVEFGCRKLRQHPAGFGAASLCVCAPVPESMGLARRLLDQAGYVGVAGVETKRHEVTGEVVFLEANVRIPTQWGLGDIAGGESSWRLYSVLAGLPVGPQPRLRYGARLVFPELEVHAALGSLREQGKRPQMTCATGRAGGAAPGTAAWLTSMTPGPRWHWRVEPSATGWRIGQARQLASEDSCRRRA